MSIFAEYKRGIIDDVEFNSIMGEFNRQERDAEREMDYLPEDEEDDDDDNS